MVTKLKNIVPKKLLRQPLTREEVEKIVYDLLPFGYVKGRIGPWRVRWQNGKPVIYKKAETYHASQTAASINNRNNMGAAFRLAAALNKDILKEVWTNAQAEGNNSYTRLIKHFRKTLKGNVPSVHNSITPAGHHFAADNLVTFDSDKTIRINKELHPSDALVIILIPYEPIKAGLNESGIITLCSGKTDDPEIKLSDAQQEICRNYKKYILYSVLIRRTDDEITWSNTTAAEGEFCANEINAHLNVPEEQYLHRNENPPIYHCSGGALSECKYITLPKSSPQQQRQRMIGESNHAPPRRAAA